jgi:hypothetical protein
VGKAALVCDALDQIDVNERAVSARNVNKFGKLSKKPKRSIGSRNSDL